MQLHLTTEVAALTCPLEPELIRLGLKRLNPHAEAGDNLVDKCSYQIPRGAAKAVQELLQKHHFIFYGHNSWNGPDGAKAVIVVGSYLEYYIPKKKEVAADLTKRYQLRQELRDNTLEEPYYSVDSKHAAMRLVKQNAKTTTRDESGHGRWAVVSFSVWDRDTQLCVFSVDTANKIAKK